MSTKFLAFVLLCSNVAFASPELLLDQGWSEAESKKAHHWNLGAQLMPARWFFALEASNSEKKFSDGLERFGFIESVNSGLPVGMTLDENEITSRLYQEKRWVGVNCAACHTSALEVKGVNILIDGNPSQVRLQDFEESIIESVEVTLASPPKLARFAKTLEVGDLSALAKNLKMFRDEFKESNLRNHHYIDRQGIEVRWGPGRIDGLGGATNDLACRVTPRLTPAYLKSLFAVSKNCGPSQAPSSVPHLWGMTNQDLFQWNGQVHASLGRNVGAMMASYGKNWVEAGSSGLPKVRTTVRIGDVFKIEDLYKKLTAPTWQSLVDHKLAEELDQQKVSQGERLFARSCQGCHASTPKLTDANQFQNRYWDYPMVSVKEVGTDPYYNEDETNRKTYINPVLAPVYLAIFGRSNLKLNGKVPASSARGILPTAALATYFTENRFSKEQISKLNNCRGDKGSAPINTIKAKSLEGILFTAPYLHNGSVPTIYDLLETPGNRPTRFYIGCRKYSLETFGFTCEANDPNAFEFDTSLQGNSNSGHDYGTDLSITEKSSLVEYLKSLRSPPYAPGNTECN